jgi:CHAT domain-containing protein
LKKAEIPAFASLWRSLRGLTGSRDVVIALTALAAIACLLFSGLRHVSSIASRTAIADIARTTESMPFRLSEARLSIDARYLPPPPKMRGDTPGERPLGFKGMTLFPRIEYEAADQIEGLHARGIARLLINDAAGAVREFRQAINRADAINSQSPVLAAIWNDLAVAHYELGRRGDAVNFVAALDAAERAWRMRRSPEIAWTRALLLETLHLREAAAKAWSQILELDSTSRWADEAHKHELAEGGLRSDAATAAPELTHACARGDLDAVKRIAAIFPKESRTLAEEEILPGWAAAYLNGSPEETSRLRSARMLGLALRLSSGESLIADIVASIDATANEPARRRQTAEAIVQYKEAREAQKQSRIDVAEKKLGNAERRLRAAGNPLAILANLYRGSATYSANRYADVVPTIVENDESLARSRYLAARGLRGWIIGLASAQTGNLAASADSYERALSAFRQAGEMENVASMLNLRAEVLDYMTATDEGWTDRMAGLEMFGYRAISRRPLIWMGVATAAIRDHYDYAADLILGEINRDAYSRQDARWMAEAAMWRAVARARIGDPFSDGDLDAIRRTVARIDDTAVRARTEANLRFVTAEIRRSSAASPDLDEALDFYQKTNDRFNGTSALAQHAMTRAAATDFDSADANLVAAVSALEQQARDVPDPLMRTLFAERARALLLLSSQVQIMRNRPLAALWLSDRARQVALRTFSQVATPAEHADAELLGRELLKKVPAGVTIVHQDLRSDQLLTWVIRDTGVYFAATPVSASSLIANIEEFRTKLLGHSPEETIQQGKALYTTLLGNVRDAIAGDGLLVYSPPPALRGVPIAVLDDGAHFLVENRTIAITRSVGAYLSRRPTSTASESTALVALPPPDPNSPSLEGALWEAATIAKLYGARGTSLTGSEATPARFTSIAPLFDVIHVGTHGRTDRRPLQNAIEFGTARLRAYDVLSMHLTRAPVVILAGCRTDDEMEGRSTLSLASSFIAAGASAVVGSLWNVDDQGTARLMIDFHRQLLRGLSAADALRSAQQSAIVRHEDISSWAAFQLQM